MSVRLSVQSDFLSVDLWFLLKIKMFKTPQKYLVFIDFLKQRLAAAGMDPVKLLDVFIGVKE